MAKLQVAAAQGVSLSEPAMTEGFKIKGTSGFRSLEFGVLEFLGFGYRGLGLWGIFGFGGIGLGFSAGDLWFEVWIA